MGLADELGRQNYIRYPAARELSPSLRQRCGYGLVDVRLLLLNAVTTQRLTAVVRQVACHHWLGASTDGET